MPIAHAEVLQESTTLAGFWNKLADRLLSLSLSWESTKLYQDGLPAGGREVETVLGAARRGSQNHQLLLALMDRGATIVGTESPSLLYRERQRIQRLADAARTGPVTMSALKREGDQLLRERDAFIADRIDATLRDGQFAILFIGFLHRVDELLRGRIEVTSFHDSLPPGAPWQARLERSPLVRNRAS